MFAIIDMVSRKWTDTLVSVEESATQVKVIFEHAVEIEGLLELLTDQRLDLDVEDPAPDPGCTSRSATSRSRTNTTDEEKRSARHAGAVAPDPERPLAVAVAITNAAILAPVPQPRWRAPLRPGSASAHVPSRENPARSRGPGGPEGVRH